MARGCLEPAQMVAQTRGKGSVGAGGLRNTGSANTSAAVPCRQTGASKCRPAAAPAALLRQPVTVSMAESRLPELLEEKEVEVNSLSFFWTHGFSSTNIQPLLGHWALEMGWERRGQRSRGGSSRRWACRGWRLGLSDKNTQSSPGLSHPPSVTLGATTPGGRGRPAGG